MAELKLSVGDAAKILHVRRATLSDVNSKAALSPEMAPRIEKALGVDMLLQMQAWHDARAMRRTDGIHVRRYKPPAVHPR